MFENYSKYRIWICFGFDTCNIEGDFLYNFQTPCSSCKSKKKKGYLLIFCFHFRAAILDLPVDLPCHNTCTELVEQHPGLQDLVMLMLPEEVVGLQVIRWWPVRHHHLRLTWVNYAAPAKKAPIAAVFNHLFFFVVLYRSPITTVFIISHAISIFNVGGCWSIGCLVCSMIVIIFFSRFYHNICLLFLISTCSI